MKHKPTWLLASWVCASCTLPTSRHQNARALPQSPVINDPIMRTHMAFSLLGLCFMHIIPGNTALEIAQRVGLKGKESERPLAKVIRILQDMKIQLEKERADDEAVFEQLTCWCETNGKEKKEAVAAAEARVADLKAITGEFSGKLEELKVNIKTVDEKLRADREALA